MGLELSSHKIGTEGFSGPPVIRSGVERFANANRSAESKDPFPHRDPSGLAGDFHETRLECRRMTLRHASGENSLIGRDRRWQTCGRSTTFSCALAHENFAQDDTTRLMTDDRLRPDCVSNGIFGSVGAGVAWAGIRSPEFLVVLNAFERAVDHGF